MGMHHPNNQNNYQRQPETVVSTKMPNKIYDLYHSALEEYFSTCKKVYHVWIEVARH
jgi:hypothetical protein